MNTKQCLSIEQMQHLKELGVDTSKASMKWVNKCQNAFGDNWEKVPVSVNLDTEYYQSFGYAFTLQDILDLLPKKLQHRYEDYELTAFYCHMAYEWKVQYLNNDISFMDYKSGENLIDAAYNMLCWVVENGYLEKSKQ